MDYIYNYAFLWISLITRTERSFFFFFTVTKKKKKEKSRVPSIVRSFGMSPSRGGGRGEEKGKEKKNPRFRFFERTKVSLIRYFFKAQ